MNTAAFTESVVEDAALAWLESLGYTIKHSPDIRHNAKFGGQNTDIFDPNGGDGNMPIIYRRSLS
jgi:hypothetical protein